jgi:SAM-dependent methyltransferase
MIATKPCATFRDPAGSLRFEDDLVIRSVTRAARVAALEFLDSALCKSLQQRGDLIDATILQDSDGLLTLKHPRVPVASYPWEWTPSQWLAAAELTLNLCDEALEAGWILKDATPLNILFEGTRPIFVDILSFERRELRSSLWLAYGQYVRTFLLPLLMNRKLGWPLSLTLFNRDGYEPVDCYAALGWPDRLSREAFWPVTLPTLLDRRKKAEAVRKPTTPVFRDPEVSARVLKRTYGDLRRRTRKAMPPPVKSEWSEYQDTLTHYTKEQSTEKLEWVRRVIDEARPDRVLDIGANTGEFSLLAAEAGAEVVALERDAAAAERLFLQSRQRGARIHTIHGDLARPTPAAGWENSESLSLLSRLEGQFELVLMLAVIHHLLLMEQIPLPAILDLCYRMTQRCLILEWVPVGDPMYQSLMRGREALYGSLSEEDLIASCAGKFNVGERHALPNGRILYRFEKIA